jgi:hypothetical protein
MFYQKKNLRPRPEQTAAIFIQEKMAARDFPQFFRNQIISMDLRVMQGVSKEAMHGKLGDPTWAPPQLVTGNLILPRIPSSII